MPSHAHSLTGGLLLCLVLALAPPMAARAAAPPTPSRHLDVIPQPLSVQTPDHAAAVRIADGTPIFVSAGDAKGIWTARYLRDLALRTRGLKLVVRTGGPPPAGAAILLERIAKGSMDEAAYTLDAENGRVRITAAGDAGLFYGAVTLWQLLTPDAGRGAVTLTPTRIADLPRFSWRGLLLDSSRHYQSVAFIERMIDWMALHKLNVLQWHLTDDQAWRLEIRKYPKLTQVGAWRVPAGAAAAADIDPKTGQPRLYGGVYTQDQVRAVVAYADARHVTIVPEIEMPGHALSAMLAYPELSASGPAPRSAQSDWGIFPYIYNYDDHAFAFLEDVLIEVVALFPGRYIAVGGDEAVKDQWKSSPAIQAQIKALGLANEDALQGRFTQRIERFLEAHGRRLVGWDDILTAGLPPEATVTSWHGPDGATAAAKAGHDVIMATDPVLYFDHRQTDLPGEPPGRGVVVSLHDVYVFEPAPPTLAQEDKGHILGLQANLWTEHVRTQARVEAMTFPRAAAVAEVGWSQPERKDWPAFAAGLPAAFARYRALGLRADENALAVRLDRTDDPAGPRVQVSLSNQLGLGQVRYTTDGTEPGPLSPAFAAPLSLTQPARIRAATFDGGRRLSPSIDARLDPATLRRRVSQDLRTCTGKLVLNLEGAGAAHPYLVDIMNPCWMFPGADLTGVTGLTVAVTRLPFNFQLGADLAKIPVRPPQTPQGELEVRLDTCAGELVASLPLARATLDSGVTPLSVRIPPRAGRHDLCIAVNAKGVEPLWAVDWVALAAPPTTVAVAAGR